MGPYDTEAAACDEPMPQAVAALHHTGNPGRAAYMLKLRALYDVCSSIPLGHYDRRILEWVAGWEPATVQAIVGIIRRASSVR